MRYVCAAVAFYAAIVSALFVPTYAQNRIKPAGPMAMISENPGESADSFAPPSSQIDITGPTGSGQFGSQVVVLPNGNIVVTDSLYDITTPSLIQDVGAVYLYDAETLAMISQLTGSSANDFVGSGGITVLTNGNYVVRSSSWDNGAITQAGAVTWGSGTTGISGIVSASNSLVGSTASDSVGGSNVIPLSNGNYLVPSPNWDNGVITQAGAVTWGSGTTGVSGAVSAAKSLVGSTASDQVGANNTVTALSNGNYVARTPNWGASDFGAVTWGSGTTGISGTISPSNSLVGSTLSDQVGSSALTALSNGNYVVRSGSWDNGAIAQAGAVTWGSGTTGISGVVSASNSLVGSTASDQVGIGVTALSNGSYVVRSPNWGATDLGAVTWGSGTTGVSGAISASNSLVGSTASDLVGTTVVALSNGNYVVNSSSWDHGAITQAGAVTWGSGMTGISGTVSASNSLVGSTASDQVGSSGSITLSNGNYVVRSPNWGASDFGAVTWGSGTTGISGEVSGSNSLVGSTLLDQVGSHGIAALSNGNYVVPSPNWDNGAIAGAGAVTWGDGTVGVSGTVSSSNSLVGSTADDIVGLNGITVLSNGNYVVVDPNWDNGAIVGAGAVIWGSGTTGISGAVSASNSLVGSTANDAIGNLGIVALSNGSYVVNSPYWGSTDFGAVTWGSGTSGVSGVVSAANSLVGSTANDQVGAFATTALSNGNYVVDTINWDNGAITQAGAVTWGSGATGVNGTISASNSLVGTTANDVVGIDGITALSNGNYIVSSGSWDNGAIADARAVTHAAGNGGTVGPIESSNSIVGTAVSGLVNSASPIVAPYSKERIVAGRPTSSIVTILNPKYTSVADGNWSAAATWNYGSFSEPHEVVIPSGRTLTLDANVPGPGGSLTIDSGGQLVISGDRSSASPISNAGIFDLSLGKLNMGANLFSSVCGAIENGTGAGSYIVGAAQKQFCTTGSFTFPIGTASGYSPVSINITSLNTNPSSLTISSTASVHPGLYAPNSLGRFWSITESGDLTADFVFTYLDADVNGTESSYKLFRESGADPVLQPCSTVDTVANTMSISGVSEFSNWAIGNLAPSAADVSVSGRVTALGRPVSRAIVRFYDGNGVMKAGITNTFGYYKVTGLSAGSTYAASVLSRRHSFETRLVSIGDDLTGFNFVAQP